MTMNSYLPDYESGSSSSIRKAEKCSSSLLELRDNEQLIMDSSLLEEIPIVHMENMEIVNEADNLGEKTFLYFFTVKSIMNN